MTNIIKSIEGNDSECIVTFEAGTEAEQRAVMKTMQEELAKQNMWANDPTKLKDNIWRINYGYDSGD